MLTIFLAILRKKVELHDIISELQEINAELQGKNKELWDVNCEFITHIIEKCQNCNM